MYVSSFPVKTDSEQYFGELFDASGEWLLQIPQPLSQQYPRCRCSTNRTLHLVQYWTYGIFSFHHFYTMEYKAKW